MTHVLTPGKISKGSIRGAHDEAVFLDVLVRQGNGEVVSKMPLGPDTIRYEYLLYQRGPDGKVLSKQTLQDRSPKTKSVISGLTGEPDLWRARFVAALDEAVQAMKVPAEGGEFELNVNGSLWRAILRDGVLATIYPA